MDDRDQVLVSVIAISYNHASYIQAALDSIFSQSYKAIEIIIVDDASTDDSAAIIQQCIAGTAIQFIKNELNSGNCKSFNKAFVLSKGKYIIDFALDDLMYPDRIAKQVSVLEKNEERVGVCFSNVDIIDTESKYIKTHYPSFYHRLSASPIPEGNVFEALLSRYYINPVSMMFRRTVIESLNGYDETLAYEDFDFWIRSSRTFQYVYIPEVLSAKRIVPTSLSGLFYKEHQEHMFESTLGVCKKAWWLCKTNEEKRALMLRCRYEAKQALRFNYASVVKEYLKILKTIDPKFYLYNSIVRSILFFKT